MKLCRIEIPRAGEEGIVLAPSVCASLFFCAKTIDQKVMQLGMDTGMCYGELYTTRA